MLGVMLFTAACALLADWQWHRRTTVRAAIHLVTANYDQRPVPLGNLLPGDTVLPRSDQWRPVRLRGTYASVETLVVRDRGDGNGNTGYLVLVPLRLPSGRAIVVDRGWVAAGTSAERPARIPAPPRGPVTVVARLLRSEAADPRAAPAGQVQAIDVPGSVRRAIASAPTATATSDAAGLVTGAFAMRVSESPTPRSTPEAEAPPSTDEGPHLAYAVQWCLFAIGAWAFLIVHMRRQGYVEDVAAGRRAPRAELVVLDPRRRRTDEEVEDAQLDAAQRAHQEALEARWIRELSDARSRHGSSS